ncbi:peptidase S9 [Sphingobacterium mizutaii NBRC 14946 = DSM 11724]|uniref:Prolyl tripeptidyl peptidase n=2 Tax=Sphingobacterium mizutaii TaxID=1010 RepID=A0AAJ4XCM9_9SPHI|nr:prolyl oligopeptidase family serine peptidase [Sphingobacterium mizutaii]GEM68219.1 peptidase S9 [Sphingobacterium mizutaii NBRC 14946 = DSM 11724]SDL09755.1 Dipeptidyl aminopeptidase/acylaminoacyl peptidase [Sphingobacterium mizutaii]SNV51430.1 Prolyl tripeptidyl peptidase precursor [Sphingobacterium mizutaii]
MKRKFGLILLGLSAISLTYAQKKPIDHTVYDSWNVISKPEISKSGNLILYSITPQEGDATAILKNANNQNLIQIPRGADLKLTKDEKHLVSLIKASFQEVRQAKIKKKKPDEMPKDSLLVFNIAKNQTNKFGQVKSYKIARNGNDFVAFLHETKLPSTSDSSKTKSGSKKDKPTSTLTVLNLNTADTSNILKADSYEWSDDGKFLVYSIKGPEKDSLNESGLFIMDLANKSKKKISSGKGNYKNIQFDDATKQLSFLADKTAEKSLLKEFKLYYYTASQDSAVILADRNSNGIPQNWFVSGDGALTFSKSGKRLFFGLAPIPRVKDTTLVEFEHAKVDIWHWQDDYLQPMQLVNLKRDLSRNYTAMINLASNRNVIPLSDETFNRISLTGDADNEWAMATSDKEYRIETQWEGGMRSDIYAISTLTGKNKLVTKSNSGYASLSPNGDYIVYFNRSNGNWYSFNIASETSKQLNEGLPVSFVDEENDVPAAPGPYGIAGWSKDGKNIYINDRYDIWKLSLDGKTKTNLTNGQGRQNQMVYRIEELFKNDDPRINHNQIDESKTVFLNGFNKIDKIQGLYKLGKKDISKLWSGPHTYRMLSADEKLNKIIYTKEDYQHSPDLYLLANFKNETRLSDINPQQANYNWGTAELVHWTTPKGYKSEGILYKPEDFDPNKKYPIIAYFYETLSDGLYTYQAPAPTPSRLNIPYFVSNGYLVFAPDIRYETGYPGRSAEEFINSGMHFLARNNNWVDSTKMGIQGQSWGGYQVAHLITRTNMYAAAWAGAPVVNMTSAYGGIRWGTGMSRQFQYENTQSRIGKPLWEARDLYIENSPLFFMDKVNTPVAIMHNDNDGAVPWYQGIEFFTALRRLNKPVWLLNYNGDDHNLIQRQNRKDIQIREAQFFDHFLKGKAAANWIKKGVKATEKGIDWGLEVD